MAIWLDAFSSFFTILGEIAFCGIIVLAVAAYFWPDD